VLALRSCQKVYCAFVFDRDILDPLPRADRRVEFIRESLVDLDTRLRAAAGRPGAGLIVRHGKAVDEIVHWRASSGYRLFSPHTTTNRRPSHGTGWRSGALAAAGIALHTTKDHVILEGRELLTQDRHALHGVHALQERLAGPHRQHRHPRP
jgi:deoxyribodipyrimidine photo-lyase